MVLQTRNLSQFQSALNATEANIPAFIVLSSCHKRHCAGHITWWLLYAASIICLWTPGTCWPWYMHAACSMMVECAEWECNGDS